MTRDLQGVTHDKHVHVTAGAAPALSSSAPARSASPREDSGIVRADRLPDNIGYMEIVSLSGTCEVPAATRSCDGCARLHPGLDQSSPSTSCAAPTRSANGGELVPLGHGMWIFVPIGRVENPTTGSNWEVGPY